MRLKYSLTQNPENMSDELLSKENKFYELNVELERKTKELMREVNSVVNTRTESLFASDSIRGSLISTKGADKSGKFSTKSKYVSESTINDFQSLTRPNQIPADDEDAFEKSSSGVRSDAVVRFFKSKSKILETELEAIKLEYKKKCDYSGELQAENKKIDEERVRYQGQLTALKETLAKSEAVNKGQLNSLQRSESENTALKKEIESLKKELKASNQSSSSCGIRLNRSLEDNERLRKALKCSQLDEKELREENRKLEEDKKSAVTNLEKQRAELIHLFKKQMLLVENLKRQKAHLEASLLIKYTEEELMRLLDWKLEDV